MVTPLVPIPLGPDVLLTQTNGPYAQNDQFDNFNGGTFIPMGNGVTVLAAPVFNPSPPGEVGSYARAFTVNPDGTQNWGNTVQIHTANAVIVGVALDTTRALVIYGINGTTLEARVLTLTGTTLASGTPVQFGAGNSGSFGGSFPGFNLGRPAVMGNTVLLGFHSHSSTRSVIRVQRLDITGTTVVVDFSKALNIHDAGPSSLSIPDACRVDPLSCSFFWSDSSTFASFWGVVQLDGDFLIDVSFGPNQLYDGTVYAMSRFREIQLGFVLAGGTRRNISPTQPVLEILEFNSFAHLVTKQPIVELTTTALAGQTNASTDLQVVGHQAVAGFRRTGGTNAELRRAVVVNLGTGSGEIVEIGYADFTAVTFNNPPVISELVPLSPRRVLFTYTSGGAQQERSLSITIPIVDPLRWRQRDDCLTPGSATPCICFFLPPGVVCIPPFWIRLTSTVQFGGRVGPLNRSY